MAKPDPQPKRATIRVTGPGQGRWRGGFGTPRHFTPEVQSFTDDDDLTGEEIAELMSDPELKVEFLDADGNPIMPPPIPDVAA